MREVIWMLDPPSKFYFTQVTPRNYNIETFTNFVNDFMSVKQQQTLWELTYHAPTYIIISPILTVGCEFHWAYHTHGLLYQYCYILVAMDYSRKMGKN